MNFKNYALTLMMALACGGAANAAQATWSAFSAPATQADEWETVYSNTLSDTSKEAAATKIKTDPIYSTDN